jgi:excisionase family DNA binding protein
MSKDLTQYVDTKQASQILGVAQDHINRLLISGKLRGVKLGGRWLVDKPSVEQYSPPKSSGGRPRSGTGHFERAQ